MSSSLAAARFALSLLHSSFSSFGTCYEACSPPSSSSLSCLSSPHQLSSLLHGLARSREAAESRARSLQSQLASAFSSAFEQHNSATAGLQAGWVQLTAGAGAQSKHMAEAGVKPRAAGTVVSQEVAAAAVAGGPSSISSAAHPPAAAVGSSTAAGAAKDASASGGDGKTNCFSGSHSPVAAKLSQFKVRARGRGDWSFSGSLCHDPLPPWPSCESPMQEENASSRIRTVSCCLFHYLLSLRSRCTRF